MEMNFISGHKHQIITLAKIEENFLLGGIDGFDGVDAIGNVHRMKSRNLYRFK